MDEVAGVGTRRGVPHAVRHGALTSALVLAVCAVIAVLSAMSYGATGRRLDGLTARAAGEVSTVDGQNVSVRWSSGVVVVPLAVTPPPVGTRTEIAYDPARPERAIIPGAAVLAERDRAAGGLAFSGFVALCVLVAGGWRLVSRARLRGRVGVSVPVRRVRVQRGLITRSFLETETDLWIPVYFDPVLVTLPAPASVLVRGPLRRRRLVAVEAGGVMLYPSGRVRDTEPRGRRIDNPSRPDPGRVVPAGLRRQLRADAAAVVPTPFVGLLWSYLDSGGVLGFVGATAVSAAVALWLWSVRGSDPS